jgi:hypothetical protein
MGQLPQVPSSTVLIEGVLSGLQPAYPFGVKVAHFRSQPAQPCGAKMAQGSQPAQPIGVKMAQGLNQPSLFG